jgi:NAD(P)-dependent dehydrogenase (short-subunit alcohol dehydrogenase family)
MHGGRVSTMSKIHAAGRLEGKVVVVTGGAGRLGRRFSEVIAREGGIAVAADVTAAVPSLSKSLTCPGSSGAVVSAQLDVTDQSAIDALIVSVQSTYGRIDAVVNSAYPRNSAYGRLLPDVTYQDFCKNVSLHLGGYFLVAQRFCLAFQVAGSGSVVNMSSIYGSLAPRFEIYEGTTMTVPVEYAAIKAGVEHLTRYFAKYYKGFGIRVNSLSPGGILGGQPDSFLSAYCAHCGSKGMLDPGDLDGVMVFLLSDESRYITGQNILIDDGFSL